MSSKSKQAQLEQIEADIKTNNVCPNLAQTATQIVMGDGNPDADIVFIGEAPGKNEDLQGLPFVGAAGKFLNEMLNRIGLERSDVYITNIVKYRPPNNRDPRPEEKKEFLPYLIKQLDVIEPKVIIPLGRHSMNVFMPELKISEAHGQMYKENIQFEKGLRKVVFIPLYHPAAALYNGGLRSTLFEDIERVPNIISKL